MYQNGFVILAVLCLFTLVGSCSPSKHSNVKQKKTIVEKSLGENYRTISSPSGKYALYVQNPSDNGLRGALKFLVLDTKENSILFESTFFPGHVKWHSDYELEILSVPGTIQKEDDLSKHKKIVSIAKPKK